VRTIDESVGQLRPFPDPDEYPYLKTLHDAIHHNNMTIILKARQMFVSYLLVADGLWRAFCSDKKMGEVFGGLIVSKREDDVKYLISRVKEMYHSLPLGWQVYNPISVESQVRIAFKRGGELRGLPASENIGRTHTASWVLLDEGAFLPFARQMWAGLVSTVGATGKVIMPSTPNGKFNFFHDVWNGENTFKKVFLHWSDHPFRDEKWKYKMKPEIDPNDQGIWDQEMEGSFITQAGKKVYPEFSRSIHVREFADDKGSKDIIYRSWDFGFHHPACLWLKENGRDQMCVLMEYMGEDVSTREFARKVLELSEAQFPNARWKDVCDIAGRQKQSISDKNEKSDVDVLHSMGIYPAANKINIRTGLELVHQALKMRADGHPGLLVDSGCETLIDGFLGGYHYPDRESPGETPEKDGYYDHVHDCLRYLVFQINKWRKRMKKPRRRKSFHEEYAY